METRELILRCAQELMQTQGYNAFSFRDIAADVGVKSASVHHHFAAKEDLGVEVIRRYGDELIAQLERIPESSAEAKVQGLIRILNQSMTEGNKVCLCAMLMSDSETLPGKMRTELQQLISRVEKWLARVLEDGRESGEFGFEGNAGILARAIFASFQGIMLCTRAHGEPERFLKASRAISSLLTK